MQIVVPITSEDVKNIRPALALWASLGSHEGHSLLVLAPAGLIEEASSFARGISQLPEKLFDRVSVSSISMSDRSIEMSVLWSKYFSNNPQESLWMELGVIPLVPNWVAKLAEKTTFARGLLLGPPSGPHRVGLYRHKAGPALQPWLVPSIKGFHSNLPQSHGGFLQAVFRPSDLFQVVNDLKEVREETLLAIPATPATSLFKVKAKQPKNEIPTPAPTPVLLVEEPPPAEEALTEASLPRIIRRKS